MITVVAVVAEAVVGEVAVAAVDIVAVVDAAVVLNECVEQDLNGHCPSQGLKMFKLRGTVSLL